MKRLLLLFLFIIPLYGQDDDTLRVTLTYNETILYMLYDVSFVQGVRYYVQGDSLEGILKKHPQGETHVMSRIGLAHGFTYAEINKITDYRNIDRREILKRFMEIMERTKE